MTAPVRRCPDRPGTASPRGYRGRLLISALVDLDEFVAGERVCRYPRGAIKVHGHG